MLKYFFLILTLVRVACHSLEIQDIPEKDREKLEKFFKLLITKTSLGYTLCGDKPCSIESCPNLSKIPSRYAVNIFFKYHGYATLVQGVETWNRYAHHFPSTRFVFRYVPTYNTLVLINKNAAKRVIEENIDLFQKLTNSSKSAKEFLCEVCFPADVNKDYLIKRNITLLGILLGYGRNNAMAFEHKCYFLNLKRFELDNSYQPLCSILNPGFVCIENGTNDKENEKIKRTLRQAKQSIRATFRSEDYFETFMRILKD